MALDIKQIFLFIISTVLICLLPASTYAQKLGDSDAPVEIAADNSLEWLQKKQQYVANGNVEVTQGLSKIFSDKLVADYRENKQSGDIEIWQLTAYGNVRIQNETSKIQGNKAIYDVNTGLSIITGDNLKLTLPDQTITARERMEYNSNNGIAKAIGSAKIVRGSDILSANSITANFLKDNTGKQQLSTATANGNVTIQTPDETLTGNHAKYNAVQNTAQITGNVKLKRGPNILEGARAEVNLATNVSKMFGAPKSGKRVKGVFFPSSQPKTGNN